MKTLKAKVKSTTYKELLEAHKEIQKEIPYYRLDDLVQRALSDFLKLAKIPKFIEYLKEQKAKENIPQY